MYLIQYFGYRIAPSLSVSLCMLIIFNSIRIFIYFVFFSMNATVTVHVSASVPKIHKFHIFITAPRLPLLSNVYLSIDLHQDKKQAGAFYNCPDNPDIYKRRKNINNIVESCDLADPIHLRTDAPVYVWCNTQTLSEKNTRALS